MNWRSIYDETMSSLKESVESFDWENAEAYSQWLGQTFHFVNHSTRLLALASANTPMEQQELHNRYIDHAKEERSHEVLLVRDLKALDRKVDEIPELYPTAGLFKTQYFYLEHGKPAAFLGWVLMLESVASQFGPDVLERVVEAHGEKAGVFWKVHAHEDQDHVQKAFLEVERAPEADREDIIRNFQHSAKFYIDMLKECQEVSQQVGLPAAA